MTRILPLLALLGPFAASGAFAQEPAAPKPTETFQAPVKNAKGDPIGTIAIRDGANSLVLRVAIQPGGLPPGWHGLHFHAVDVGRGQLHPRLAADPRVTSLEGTDIRTLDPAQFVSRPTLASVDVSFIGLRLVLPALPALLAPGAAIVALIKPQFEAGRERVGRGGLVRDPAVHAEVCAAVRSVLEGLGAAILGLIDSPVPGGDGNSEFLIGAKVS